MGSVLSVPADPLELFSHPVREWFSATFSAPTLAQQLGWPAIAEGEHTLLLAPTGSGKTLAAFLWSLDRLGRVDPRPGGARTATRVLYVSPLKALAVDVEKNLRGPLTGIALAARRLGDHFSEPSIGMRTGDTSPADRRRLINHPPDVLITTPESLYLMLTSRAREALRGVETVIVDEIHAVAGTKRGAHLALSLERLEELVETSPQRIGLSATQRPLSEIAGFLGGCEIRDARLTPRPVTVVDAGVAKELDVEIVVPVEDMGDLGRPVDEHEAGPGEPLPARRSIWPAMHPELLDLIRQHRSTLVFVNSRRLAERLATRLNELASTGESRGDEAGGVSPVLPDRELVKAHHGSLSRERRLYIEDQLKRGELRALVATSSLELGIDMGAVDLVIQVESPGSVSRGLQRIGRAGHQVGQPSRGRIFPKHRSDLAEAAVVLDRMKRGLIEETRYPRNPLDVLAQQIVAMCSLEEWSVERLTDVVRRAANFSDLGDDVLNSVLDLLAGRYPAEQFSELRPRLVWDRLEGRIRGRAGTQWLAVTSGGTIPDRGLFGVHLPDGTRVGELDEEMVYESRPGETFLLGATTWRIEDISFDRVVVTPAPGSPGKMPFWHGEGPGRPLELGRALGAFVREIRHGGAADRLESEFGLDERAAVNLTAYLDEQAQATGAVPDDRTIVVERFRDEIGDWRVCVLSPFGARVHAPWAMALQSRLEDRWGLAVELMWSDDGMVMRLPEAIDELPAEDLLIDPDEIHELVVSQLPRTAMFASRFRECAARSLLLPRRRPDRRTPLWQQRQRAADLLAVAANHPTFPVLLEATRECLNDVFDLPALHQLLSDLQSRRVRLVSAETDHASPFAQSLLFGWIAIYMYEGDAPLAERRAAALAVDRDLLRELLGADELRELIDPEVMASLELDLQRLSESRRASNADEVHDLLRTLGPLPMVGIDARTDHDGGLESWIEALVEEGRAIRVRVAGEDRIAAADDAARLRDAVGVALPVGLPAAFTEPVEKPLRDLMERYARTHVPFLTREAAAWLGVPLDAADLVLAELEATDRVVRGEFRPDGAEREWCDQEVLRQLRRRSLAALRREVEPVDGSALARFLPAWQGVGVPRRGLESLVEIIGLLQGAPIPASVLENDVLPARMAEYRPADLDSLCTAGEIVWVGAGPLGPRDGRVRLVFRDQVGLLVPAPSPSAANEEIHRALRDHLDSRGASFWPDLVQAVAQAGEPYDDEHVLAALWDLVWAGEVTNDSLAPVRALGGSRRRGSGRRARPGRLGRLGPPAAAGRWSLVGPLRPPGVSATEMAHARALQLLDRYGVLTREAAIGEGAEGGFAGVYPVLKALEERGQVRRGYFVAGLGAAQFAQAGAVDRLRGRRDSEGDEIVTLAATDPAQPFGAALPWPETSGRPGRSAGAYVVIDKGEAVAFLDRGGRSLVTFPATGDSKVWPAELARLVETGRLRSVEVARVDGRPVGDSEVASTLKESGWISGYRGLRPPS